jgi:hypothetical protein
VSAPGLVLPRWGTGRRTREEWLDRGGDPKVGNKADEWWPTLGHQPAMVSRRLNFPPMPHQLHIFDVAFELHPESPENLWYTEADVWVMRQCAKTTTIFVVIVHRLTMMPRRMGGRQRAVFTMQDRQETRKKLVVDFIPQLVDAAESFRRIENQKARPGRSTQEWQSSLNNGGEYLLFGQGNFMHIETPSKKAGHGGTIDVKGADEVRFGIDDRTEASGGPSQITRRSRQLWVASTAGDEDSFYMWPKVLAGRSRIDRRDTETRVCSFEWAIPEDADLHDPDVWYEYHPAAGHTIKVSDILDELRNAEDSPDETKIDTFRQEYANQWIRHPILGDQGHEVVVDLQTWSKRKVPIATALEGPRTLGISVADDGRTASIAVAGWNSAGHGQVNVLDFKPGTFWIEQALEQRREEWGPEVITYNAGGPTAAIEGPIARGAGRVDVEPIRGQSYTGACAAFVTGFEEGRYCHVDQEWLNTAIEGAAKKARGTGWLWDMQNSRADITPLDAATVALRALEGRPPERRSAYEDDDLLTV